MKKRIILLVGVVLLMTACQKEDENVEVVKEDIVTEIVDIEKENEVTKDEETFDVLALRDKTRYEVTMDSLGEKYNIFFYADDEKEYKSETTSYLSEKGDKLHEGHYKIALAKKGAGEAIIQNHIELFYENDGYAQTFNSKMENIKVIKSKKRDSDLLAIFLKESTNYTSAELFEIRDGKLVQLTKDAKFLMLGTDIKVVKENVLQTAEYNNNGEIDNGWIFNTWEIVDELGEISLVEKNVYNDDVMNHGFEIGKSIYENWKSVERVFLPIHDIILTNEFIEHAKKGKMFGEEVGIGATKEELERAKGPFINEGYYEGGYYHGYNNAIFIFDTEERVGWIAMKGKRISSTLEEVKDVLGEPSSSGFNEMDGINYINYNVGEYVLTFDGSQDDEKVSAIWLQRKY